MAITPEMFPAIYATLLAAGVPHYSATAIMSTLLLVYFVSLR